MGALAFFRQRTLQREIAPRDDADEPFIAVHYRKAPNLQLRHILNHVRDFLILKAVFNLLAHYVLDCCIRHLSLGDRASWQAQSIIGRAGASVLLTSNRQTGDERIEPRH